MSSTYCLLSQIFLEKLRKIPSVVSLVTLRYKIDKINVIKTLHRLKKLEWSTCALKPSFVAFLGRRVIGILKCP